MNSLKTKLKRKSLKNKKQKNSLNIQIQPFKQLPSVNKTGQGSADRINAHDLFSHYTGEIIKAETIFVR